MSRRSLAVAAGLVLALAACGGSGRSGDSGPSRTSGGDAAAYATTPVAQIRSDVEAALKGAGSLHLAGTIAENGARIRFDVSVDTSGDCTGTMGLQGATIRILGAGGAYYFKAPRAFWRAQDPARAAQIWGIVGGKWVKMASGGQESEMASLCNLSHFTTSVFGSASDEKTASVVGPSQFAGRPTVELSGRSGGSSTTIQVLAAAPHYPVLLDAGSQGEITFSRFDEPVTVSAPPSGQVVDLNPRG